MSFTRSTLTLWPATPLPAQVAKRLRALGIDVQQLHLDDRSVSLSRAADGMLVMQISLTQLSFERDELELLCSALQAGNISYVEWRSCGPECGGVVFTFDAEDLAPRRFAMSADGERQLTTSDLGAFEHHETIEELIGALRDWLRLPAPPQTTPVSAREAKIEVDPDECEPTTGDSPADRS